MNQALLMFYTLLVSCAFIAGYCCMAPRCIPIKQKTFFVIPLLLIYGYLIAIFQCLVVGSKTMIAAGVIALLAYGVITLCKAPQNLKKLISYNTLLVMIFTAFTMVYIYHADIGSIDDYSYWASISKYLYWHNNLPNLDSGLSLQHLSYTPGLGCWHYVFFQIFGNYSPVMAYFAQDFVIFSALLVVFEKDARLSFFYFSLVLLLVTLVYGSILVKLQVDALIALFVFSILWIYFQDTPLKSRLISVIPAVVALYLIKQVGLVLAAFLLCIIVLYSCLFDRSERKLYPAIMAAAIIAAVSMILIKVSWVHHWQSVGFKPFAPHVSFQYVLSLFDLTDPATRKGLVIVLREALLGKADALKVPYLIWYIIIGLMWLATLMTDNADEKKRYLFIFSSLFCMYVLYIIGFYIFEVTVFSVGTHSMTVIEPRRYLGLLFLPILLYTTCVFFKTRVESRGKLKLHVIFITAGLTICVIIGSIPQRIHHQLKAETPSKALSQRIRESLTGNIDSFICIIGGKENTKFAYYLMPNKVNINDLPADSCRGFQKQFHHCQYLLLYTEDSIANRCLKKIIQGHIEPNSFNEIVRKDNTVHLKFRWKIHNKKGLY